jgi:hypothetical protein
MQTAEHWIRKMPIKEERSKCFKKGISKEKERKYSKKLSKSYPTYQMPEPAVIQSEEITSRLTPIKINEVII